MGYTPGSQFDLAAGQAYTVYAICTWKACALLYLCAGEGDGNANWYPAELFELTDGSLPSSWKFGYYGFDSDVSAIWGYEELIEGNEHFDLLAEHHDQAVSVFTRRRTEIDAELAERSV